MDYTEVIKGVNHEINVRANRLELLKRWYLKPQDSTYQFSLGHFYKTGPRLLKELIHLKIIRAELVYLQKTGYLIGLYKRSCKNRK